MYPWWEQPFIGQPIYIYYATVSIVTGLLLMLVTGCCCCCGCCCRGCRGQDEKSLNEVGPIDRFEDGNVRVEPDNLPHRPSVRR